MPKKQGASRRSFLAGSATGLGSAWLASQWPAILAAQEHAQKVAKSGKPGKLGFFSAEQGAEVESVAAQEHAQKVAKSGKPGKLGFFSAEQGAEVESVAAQIVPTDDTPGAREAGCLYFIDRALTTFDVKKQSVYTEGLGVLQTKTKELFPSGGKFSAFSAPQ